eukprot:10119735-Lingulodinium_polyedra.AAC.1
MPWPGAVAPGSLASWGGASFSTQLTVANVARNPVSGQRPEIEYICCCRQCIADVCVLLGGPG